MSALFAGVRGLLFFIPDRPKNSILAPLMIVDIFYLWFLFVTPVATVIAFVVFMKRSRLGVIAKFTRSLIWATVTVRRVGECIYALRYMGRYLFLRPEG